MAKLTGSIDIFIEQGATLDFLLEWRDEDSNIITLSNYTSRLQIRTRVTAGTVLHSLTTENGGIILDAAAGTIRVIMTAAQTKLITWLLAKYDLELIDAAGVVTRVVSGNARASFQTTRIALP